MLELSHISKFYKQGKNQINVLSNLNLRVEKGQTLAVMGKSGSGKSTLLSIISGILKPSQGDLTLNEKSYKNLNESQLSDLRASEIGFVFQNFHLVSFLNALENVMLPAQVNLKENAEIASRELLEKVGLQARLTHLPAQLSGGEKQRVAIARSLIHNPNLILADEPSGSLDQQTGEEVMDILFDLVRAHETSLILVTHDLQVAKRCDTILYIQDGQLRINDC